MRVRAIGLSMLAAGVLCLPVGASQPEGLAGKLITNPPVSVNLGDPNGLPGVSCVGVSWGELFPGRDLGPADTVTLDLAIIPLRTGLTEVHVHGQMRLQFTDGLVNDLPYRRGGWNDVRVVIHPGSRDYMLTLNGVQGGPFPNEYPCDSPGDCATLQAASIRGSALEESTAWIDSLSLVLDSAAGREVLIDKGFDGCYESRNVSLGGLIITEPPQRTSSRPTR